MRAAKARETDDRSLSAALQSFGTKGYEATSAALTSDVAQDRWATVLDALSERMETLDPAASLSFALECPQCATRWDARFVSNGKATSFTWCWSTADALRARSRRCP